MRRLAGLTALLLCISGCGGGSTGDNPQSVAKAFAQAFARQDWKTACSFLTGDGKLSVVREFEAQSGQRAATCEGALKSAMNFADAADIAKIKQMRVTSVDVHGNSATAHFSSGVGAGGTGVGMVRKAGLWLIDLRPISQTKTTAKATSSVDIKTYTCAQFNRSLKSPGDNTAGNYINQLVARAKLGQPRKTARREITVGVFYACRGGSGSSNPTNRAIATAKKIKAGTFKAP